MDDLFARYQAALRAGHQLAADGKYREALAQYEAAARVAGERHTCEASDTAMLAPAVLS